MHYIWRWISRKPLEIEAWFQRTTNRKWHVGYRMVTWPMTSVNRQSQSDSMITVYQVSVFDCCIPQVTLEPIWLKFCMIIYIRQATPKKNWWPPERVVALGRPIVNLSPGVLFTSPHHEKHDLAFSARSVHVFWGQFHPILASKNLFGPFRLLI